MLVAASHAHVDRRPGYQGTAMGIEAMRFLVVWMAGWINSRQLEIIDYLREENRRTLGRSARDTSAGLSRGHEASELAQPATTYDLALDRVLWEQLAARRLRFTDDQRRRLAARRAEEQVARPPAIRESPLAPEDLVAEDRGTTPSWPTITRRKRWRALCARNHRLFHLCATFAHGVAQGAWRNECARDFAARPCQSGYLAERACAPHGLRVRGSAAVIWVDITGPLSALRGLGAVAGFSADSRGAQQVDPDSDADLWTASATLDSTDPIPAIEALGAVVTVVKTDAEIRALLENEWHERQGNPGDPPA